MVGMNKIQLAAFMALIAVTSLLGENPALAQESPPTTRIAPEVIERTVPPVSVRSIPVTGMSLVEGTILLGIGLLLAGVTILSCRPPQR